MGDHENKSLVEIEHDNIVNHFKKEGIPAKWIKNVRQDNGYFKVDIYIPDEGWTTFRKPVLN